ncbi:hypothetical protein POM88_031684 [Heracleum sosnowskyi]|uniref:RNase H type-1 domain-containing protein n=1 Tax=Heracleum sosnowskyi TaxID=360622 RepID=A0AAD8HZ97_9APIA|nr:hypothetical protein POM88_031684 [Heracleum sosnowskyi]
MEGIRVQWSLPPHGCYKINVHFFFTDQPLPNGNVSGIGVVIRNHKGKIVRMVAGSLGIREQRLNEHYAMLEGLKRAFLEDRFEIEVHHSATYSEARRAYRNFLMDISPIALSANALAAYLARYGAETWDRMVILAGPVGRVFELWCDDMGLGPIGDQFMAVHELDIMDEVEDADIVQGDEEVLAQKIL